MKKWIFLNKKDEVACLTAEELMALNGSLSQVISAIEAVHGKKITAISVKESEDKQ